MTINQLDTLTEEELAMALIIINDICPIEGRNHEVSARGLTWIKPNILIQKLVSAFPSIKIEGHSVYSSLMEKLGVKGEIKYETPPASNLTASSETSSETSSSISEVVDGNTSTPETGSTEKIS